MPLIIPANSITGGYEVDNSLRFNDGSSDHLERTISTNGNLKTFTFSCWVKRSTLTGSNQTILSADVNTGSQIFYTKLIFDSSERLHFMNYPDDYGIRTWIITNQVFRDVSAWYHIVIASDTTQATTSNRTKIYVNGEQITSFSEETQPSQNRDYYWNNTVTSPMQIGRDDGGNYFDGYLSEFVFIDGQQLDPTSFGEFDANTGIWKPIDVSGLTFGTNGFYLDFENLGSLGADVSGNGNNFTVNNLTSIDQTTDTPTNNFATLNPLWRSLYNPVFSNGNLKIETPAVAQFHNAVSSLGVSSGKWYLEMKCNGSPNSANYFGIGNEDEIDNFSQASTVIGNTTQGFSFFLITGDKRTNGSNSSYGSALADGDIMMYAIDLDNGKVWFGKNGTFFASGDPASGTNEAFSGLSGTFFIGGSLYNGGLSSVEFNFGNPPFTISSGNSDSAGYGNFEYAVPSGYYALCTANLAEFG